MKRKNQRTQGFALVLTLSILVLITILVVGLSSIMVTEHSAASRDLEHQKAIALGEVARDHAIAVLRDGIEGGRSANEIWASQPGKITVFNRDGTVDTGLSRLLSSGTDTTQPEVDLNQATFGGNNPIASANSVSPAATPVMPVNWVNVMSDPTTQAGATNPLVGRYAFWVDDESSKVNINTADGTSKYNPQTTWDDPPSAQPISFGNGMPTEVNLQGLTGISTSGAQTIASITGVRPGLSSTRWYNDAREILGLKDGSGVQPDYTDNNFNLTSTSRSPELNIFGEPKIYLMTAGKATPASTTVVNLGMGAYPGFNSQINVGVPLRQVYPSSDPYLANPAGDILTGCSVNVGGAGNQLPPFVVNPAITAGGSVAPNSPLPQYALWDMGYNVSVLDPSNPDYNLGLRIAQYLKGYNSQGQAIQWPTFPGSSSTGFAGKYTDRQIDSIAVQILDLVDKATYPENYMYYTVPYIMAKGFLSGQPVKGISHGPHLNQVMMTFSIVPGDPPRITVAINCQWYFPKEYKGGPAYVGPSGGCWSYGGALGGAPWPQGDIWPYFNIQDCPQTYPNYVLNRNQITGKSPMQGPFPWWANTMLKITAKDGVTSEDNSSAGVDLFGNDPLQADPDQANAQLYHPYSCNNPTYPDGTPNPGYNSALPQGYLGSGPITGSIYPALAAGWFIEQGNPDPTKNYIWPPGDYHGTESQTGAAGYAYSMRQIDPHQDPTHPQPFTQKIANVTITGGIAVWTNTRLCPQLDPVPLDSVRGVYTGEDPTDPKVNAALLAAVIPLPTGGITLTVPSAGSGNIGQAQPPVVVLMKAADPLVNNFPGDWVSKINPSASDYTVRPPPAGYYIATYQDGAVHEFQAAGGGDPNSYWVPETSQNIPKSQRLPSVGYLQYIRTGLMPDKTNDVDPNNPATETAAKGTPFRLLSLAPSYDPADPTFSTPNPGQTTLGGGSYPDWAMLDLFTVPVSPQPLGTSDATTPPYLEMTYGGSTPGRVSINGSTALALSSPSFSRQIPLRAVFKGIQAYNAYDLTKTYPANTTEDALPTTPVDETTLSTKVANYLSTLKDANGVSRPFIMPSEIANVPEIANYVYVPQNTAGIQPYWSRNDLVRQTLGNLTTQSNTFSVWAAAQIVKKKPGNTTYGDFQDGDIVQGECRMHYIIERYIDLGTDGVPGNAKPGKAGADGIVGTPDDPIDGDDTATPPIAGANPKMSYPLPYKYRVISSEEVLN